MVDFQSRDRSRGREEEAETAAESADDGSARPEEAAGGGESETATSSGDEGVDESVSVAILVTDDGSDAAADAVADALAADHEVLGRDERTDDLDTVQSAVDTFLDQPSVEAVVTVGGVSVGPTQVTADAVEPLLDTELPGFGELFRRRYEEAAGSAAVRTRAFAGVAGTTPVFCLPGEADPARGAAADIVGPELAWLVAAASDV